MKKQWSSIHNQAGFFLPTVLLVITVVFIMISASIIRYKNELHVAHQLINYVEIETLFQMSLTAFKNDYYNHLLDENNHIYYNFPNGHVAVDWKEQGEYTQVLFIITPAGKDSSSSFTYRIPIQKSDIENID